MSHVTDVYLLLGTAVLEQHPQILDAVNSYLLKQGYAKGLMPCDRFSAGGGSVPQHDAIWGAFKNLNIPAFVEHTRSCFPWDSIQYTGRVQLLMMDEHDEGFGLIDVFVSYFSEDTPFSAEKHGIRP